MHRFEARISWSRGTASFSDNRYSRGHEWSFDGGTTVSASSSPSVVPVPYSIVEAVDPEEALVASASSCHMLVFLSLAAKRGFVVESYIDEAVGIIDRNSAGRQAFTRITLRPQVRFTPERLPSPAELDALHHAAHGLCYIANSLNFEVLVETRQAEGACGGMASSQE